MHSVAHVLHREHIRDDNRLTFRAIGFHWLHKFGCLPTFTASGFRCFAVKQTERVRVVSVVHRAFRSLTVRHAVTVSRAVSGLLVSR